MEICEINANVVDDGSPVTTVVDLLMKSKLTKSKREARDIIDSGGIYVNAIRVVENRDISTDDLVGNTIVLRRGKKSHFVFRFLNVRGT
jgi:tyrosyl-tRNA synthetase